MPITEHMTKQGIVFIDTEGKNTCGVLLSNNGMVKKLIKSIIDDENSETIGIQGKLFCLYEDLTAPSERSQTLREFLAAWTTQENIDERKGLLEELQQLFDHGYSADEAVHEHNKHLIFSMLSETEGLFERLVAHHKQLVERPGSSPP
jgi:hypothetical protein